MIRMGEGSCVHMYTNRCMPHQPAQTGGLKLPKASQSHLKDQGKVQTASCGLRITSDAKAVHKEKKATFTFEVVRLWSQADLCGKTIWNTTAKNASINVLGLAGIVTFLNSSSLCFRFVTLKRQQPRIRPQHIRYNPEGAVVQE